MELQNKMEVISGLIERMVRENAKTAQDQIEYAKRYDEMKHQYDSNKDELEKAIADRFYKQAQEIKMKAYLMEIKKADSGNLVQRYMDANG